MSHGSKGNSDEINRTLNVVEPLRGDTYLGGNWGLKLVINTEKLAKRKK